MKNTTLLRNLLICTVAAFCFSCNKYLDAKPDAKLEIPESIADLQAILDNYVVINNNDPSGGEISADNYFLTDVNYNSLSQDNFRRMYTWQKDYVYANSSTNDWFYSYRPVFSCNTVLETVDKAASTGSANDAANVRGQALFLRSKAFFQLAVIFSPAYNDATADHDLGVALRTSSDVNVPSVRATNRQTFNQIVSNLKQAIPLLPVTPLSVYRASKPAAYGLLARTYLYLHQFDQAKNYADSCIQLSPKLLDYNQLPAAKTYPITRLNTEVIFESLIPAAQPISNTKARIDSVLYRSYAANDLRKTLFFKNNNDGTFAFRGSYEAGGNLFDGVATDEIYLIRAEAKIRLNDVTGGMSDLNMLLGNRWLIGTFVPLNANNSNDALKLILTERRKELLMRGLRWMDLKRLNEEGAGIILTRYISGQTYILPANDLRYGLAIPENLISLSGLVQNPR